MGVQILLDDRFDHEMIYVKWLVESKMGMIHFDVGWLRQDINQLFDLGFVP